jgi:putative aldouronate transport system permease protein
MLSRMLQKWRNMGLGYQVFIVTVYLLLGLVALACVYPLYYVIIASFSDPGALMRHQSVLFYPLRPYTLNGFKLVFRNRLILSGYANTIFVVIAGVVVNMIMTTLGAYVISIRGLMFRKPLTIFIIFTMYFSGGMIPEYLNIRDIGLMNSLWSLILPVAINTSNLVIMRSAFMSVPNALVEAAKIDGASHWTIFTKIMLPVSKATLAVLVLYYAVSHWNSWFAASIYLRTNTNFPLQLVLRDILLNSQTEDMMGNVNDAMTPQMTLLVKYALIVVSTLPIMCLYPFIQKYFRKGVILGAIKG